LNQFVSGKASTTSESASKFSWPLFHLAPEGVRIDPMSTDHQTRRSFLKAPAVVRERSATARDVTGGGPHFSASSGDGNRATLPPLEAERNGLLVSVRRRAMACEFEVQLAAARDDNSMEHVFRALDLVEALEAQLTVFRDDSEVIRINRQAAFHPVPVEPRLFALLREAVRLYDETGGALDITSGPLSEAWGFSRREGRVPSEADIAAALDRVGMQHVILDERRQTIQFRRPGLCVNLNSMGKGYAVDRMAELLAEQGIDDYLVHGGKSSVLARGDQPGSQAAGWLIGLRHPLRPAERLAEIQLRNGSLSTSGSGTQFFIRRGRRYGHVLDPRTGRPAEGLFSATVIAHTAAEAEGLSTAFYVMGPDRVEEYCASRPELATLLVGPSDREGEVELYAFGLEDHQWQPLA
jgi:thiamine biosynthesis lipoprotein